MENINVRVEYENTPIRHIAVQCPSCKKWFRGKEISGSFLHYDSQIKDAGFFCPICNKDFGNGYIPDDVDDLYTVTIVEVDSAQECYKDCLCKREVWE